MFKNRLFHVLIAIALVIALTISVRQAFATANISSGGDAARAAKIASCASLPSRHSIHTEYEPERDIWVAYTEDGPTGVDGGLIELLSDYRTCSR